MVAPHGLLSSHSLAPTLVHDCIMCIHSTLRSDGSSSATTASMPRLSANKWNGHTGTVSSFLRALTRFRSEIPAYIQKFIFTGTYADSKGGLIMVQN